MDREHREYPSFATLYIGRSYCSGKQNLFGSSIKHSEVITLKISPATVNRNLNEDYIFSKSIPYIEIDMSQAQFAQAITSLNMGAGTPVTLRRINGQDVEQCPFEDKRMQFDNEISQKMQMLVKQFKEISKEAEDLLINKKSLSKGDRDKILSAFSKVQMELGSNMPFVYSQFNKQMEKTVTEAKSEVEGHIQSRLTDMALKGMQLENASGYMPVIEEANYETEDEEFNETEDEGMQMGGM